ncbi:MAG: hypothetical protein JO250_09195 [Armatimonadetes bacterium]|nr:hypothetical protein [Armatimonadota bacterium]
MNTDFRLAVGIFTHPKIVKLRRRLGDGAVVAHLQLLAFCAQNRPDGRLTGMDDDDIAIAGGYTGEASAFRAALVELRLLDQDADQHLAVHDWADHNPWASEAPLRADVARHAAHARWEKERASKMTQNGTPPPSSPPDAPAVLSNAPSNAPAVLSNAPSNAPSIIPQCPFPLLSSPLDRSETTPTTPSAPTRARDPAPDAARTAPGPTPPTPDATPEHGGPPGDDCQVEVVALLLKNGISEESARELAQKRPCEAIRQQVEDLPARISDRTAKGRATDDPAGLLFRAIFEGWGRPESVKRREAEAEAHRQREEAQARVQSEAAARRATEAATAQELNAAFDALGEEVQREIEEEARSRLLAQGQIWRDHRQKSPDGWDKGLPVRRLLLGLRNAILAERGAIKSPAQDPPDQEAAVVP